MGLDGISINQLRVVQEHNSAELNSPISRAGEPEKHKVVDGLNEGQKVDPDQKKQQQHEDESFEPDENSQEIQENIDDPYLNIVKYDLSDTNRYKLCIDDETNNILIVEADTNTVVQKINSLELSKYVANLSNSQGSIVNRKF